MSNPACDNDTGKYDEYMRDVVVKNVDVIPYIDSHF